MSESLDVATQLDGARLFVVGATGFLGKVWLAMLLHRYPGLGKIHLVVRAKDGGSDARFWRETAPSHPFDAMRDELGQEAFEALLREKVEAIDADVTKPLCGVPDARIRELAGTIDAVVNVAGVVDFNPPLDEALRANAFGVQNLVELARALGDVPVMHTSTVYVAGYREGQIDEQDPRETPFPRMGSLEVAHWDPAREISECLDLVAQARQRCEDAFRQSAFLADAKANLIKRGEPTRGSALENELGRVRRRFVQDRLIEAGIERARYWGWPNIYTYTKSIGEQILASSGLRYTIVRPSVIESSMAYPFPGWNEGINTMAPLVYLLMKGHLQVPAGVRTNLDIIPVDMVAGGMIAALASLLHGDADLVHQLGSSDTNPMPMHRLVELCGLYKRRYYQRAGKGNPFLNMIFARVEPTPVDLEGFKQHGAPAVANATMGLSKLLRSAAVGPAAAVLKPVSKALASYSGVAKRNGEIWGLYLPFMAETEYHFACANTRALRAKLSAGDRVALGFEPESIDWRHYMHEVHIPGLEKWVLPELDERVARPARPLRVHDSLLALLDEAVDRHDLAPALARFEPDGVVNVSFRTWRARSIATASRLASVGVRPGDRVALGGANHPDWAIAFFGILRAGGVAVPVDPALDAKALANVLRSANVRACVFDDALAHGAGRAAMPDGCVLLALGDATADDPSLETPGIPLPAPDDIASVIYTSGTTAAPKGAMLTHRNFTSLLGALAPLFPLSHGDRALSVLPLHHTFEFTCGLLLPLSRGARVVYLDELNSDRLTAAMREAKITAMVGVPALWQALERRIVTQARERGPAASAFFDVALALNRVLGSKVGLDAGRLLFGEVHAALGGNVRFLISGGAALPKETAKMFAGLGLPLAQGYGLTEAAPVLTVAKPGARPGTVGKAIPGVELRIDGADANGVGEVVARGPNVMAGYADDVEGTHKAIDGDGWLHTGDLGKLDSRGTLTLVGRSKDVVVGANGENVYPDDVERALGPVPGVQELVVLGVDDGRGGERVACLAVPTREEGVDSAVRRERARRSLRDAFARLPAAQRPAVTLLYEADLPRTATRKVKRTEARALVERLAAASVPPPAHGITDLDSDRARVRAAIAVIARRDTSEIRGATRLRADLGFDSLMAMELAVALEAALPGRTVSDAAASAETVAELEAAMLGETAPTEAPAAIDGIRSARDRVAAFVPPELPGALRGVAKAAVGLLQREFYGGVMKPRVTGRAFVPQNRNSIVVANHTSHLDMGLVKYALGTYGDELVALAARDYFFDEARPMRRAVVENFTNLAPIDRHAGLRETLRDVGALLEQGRTVLIFPEGTRSPDGAIREFKGAVGHLSLRHGVDIVPVYLGGTHEALPRDAVVPRGRALVARIGPPLVVAELRRLTEGLSPAESARRVARLCQRAVETLRDGGALDLARLDRQQLDRDESAPTRHPLVTLFDELGQRFVPGAVSEPVSFYFTLGTEPEAKWTVRVAADKCEVVMSRPEGGAADCVLKTSAEMFAKIVREGYQPGVPEFMSGAIKSNDLALLQTFQAAFRLGS